MGLPLTVAVAKLSLIAAAHQAGITPAVTTSLFWPFVLKLCFNFRPLHDGCEDMMYAVRLFLFQLGQIAFDREPRGGTMRWQRALRLVNQRLIHARNAESTSASDGESSVAFAMLLL